MTELKEVCLKAYKTQIDELNTLTTALNSEKEKVIKQFEEKYATAIDKMRVLSEEMDFKKAKLKECAESDYKETGEKKLLGGLSIRVGMLMTYDDAKAFTWATSHNLCLQLDKKGFEKIAKTQEFPFVKKEEKVLVCFPKIIKVGDENGTGKDNSNGGSPQNA